MEYYNSLVELVHEYAGKPIASLISLENDQAYYISHGIIFLTTVFVVLQILSFFSSSSGYSPSVPSGKKNLNSQGFTTTKKRNKKQQLLICGPTYSGKTALFYHLVTKDVRTTVSSIEINETSGNMEVKIPASALGQVDGKSKSVSIIDIPGHYHFKEKLNESLDDAKAIILVIDSKEKDKFSEAAEILYEILNNLTVLSDQVPILIACNKQDLQFSKKATIVEIELEKEMEELRKVKKATQDDQTKVGYLETLKKKFTFNEIKVPIKFVECSIKQEDINEIYKFINSNF